MSEYEKKLHAGNTFSDSIRNVMAGQSNAFSKIFPSQELPGIVRSFQEEPFKLMLGHYDQCRIGADYLNNTEFSILCIDSSGNFWAEKRKKGESKKLNSALVIPPVEKGQTPFPVFEQISISNKTIDFVMFLKYAFHYMSKAINNREVKFPSVIISDLAFSNVHSILDVCDKTNIRDYLSISFNSLVHGKANNLNTKLAICENHILPAMLKSSRGMEKKILADTVISGLMLMFASESFQSAYGIWTNLVRIHCSREINDYARQSVKSHSYDSSEADMYDDKLKDFVEDIEDAEDIVKYGRREAIRANSPFFHLFMREIEKVENAESNDIPVSNSFWCPSLMKMLCKQYLALFPLFGACFLPESSKGLRNNAFVELYWQDLRRLFEKVPNRLLWPPAYLGLVYEEVQRKAREREFQKYIPNIRTGGKVSKQKRVSFANTSETESHGKSLVQVRLLYCLVKSSPDSDL